MSGVTCASVDWQRAVVLLGTCSQLVVTCPKHLAEDEGVLYRQVLFMYC